MQLSDSIGVFYKKKIIDHVILNRDAGIQIGDINVKSDLGFVEAKYVTPSYFCDQASTDGCIHYLIRGHEVDFHIRDADTQLPLIEYIDTRFDSASFIEPDYVLPDYFRIGFEYADDGYVEYSYFLEGMQPYPYAVNPIGWHSQEYKEVAADIIEKIKAATVEVKTKISPFTRNVRETTASVSIHETSASITKRDVIGSSEKTAVIGSIVKQFAIGGAMAIYSAIAPVVHNRIWRSHISIELGELKFFIASLNSNSILINTLFRQIRRNLFIDEFQLHYTFNFRLNCRFLDLLTIRGIRSVFFTTLYRNGFVISERIGNLFVKFLVDPALLSEEAFVSKYVNDDYFVSNYVEDQEYRVLGKNIIILSLFRYVTAFRRHFTELIPVQSIRSLFSFIVVYKNKVEFSEEIGKTFVKSLIDPTLLQQDYCVTRYVNDDYFEYKIRGKYVLISSVLKVRDEKPFLSEFSTTYLYKDIFRVREIDETLVYSSLNKRFTRVNNTYAAISELFGPYILTKKIPSNPVNLVLRSFRSFKTYWDSSVSVVDNFIPNSVNPFESYVSFSYFTTRQLQKSVRSPVAISTRSGIPRVTKGFTSQVVFITKRSNWIVVSLQSHVSVIESY
jgi:hypothetical protein